MQKHIVFLIALILIIGSCKNQTSDTSSSGYELEDKSEYFLVSNWPELADNFELGTPTGIDLDSQGNIFVFHSASREGWVIPFPDDYIPEETILMLDRDQGKILAKWGANNFIMPHGLTVDHEDNVWLTDVARNQIFKYSHSGKLLMTLGEEKVAGSDSAHFDLPTYVAIANDGTIYVSDGYGNSRVVKFRSDGKYLMEWGEKGSDNAQFDIPHGIDLDKDGNVFIADRENSRIQSFNPTGKFLTVITGKNFGRIFSVKINKRTNNLMAIDYVVKDTVPIGSDIIVFNAAGNPISKFGRSGNYDGSATWYHDLAIDDEGDVYTVDIIGRKIERFKPK